MNNEYLPFAFSDTSGPSSIIQNEATDQDRRHGIAKGLRSGTLERHLGGPFSGESSGGLAEAQPLPPYSGPVQTLSRVVPILLDRTRAAMPHRDSLPAPSCRVANCRAITVCSSCPTYLGVRPFLPRQMDTGRRVGSRPKIGPNRNGLCSISLEKPPLHIREWEGHCETSSLQVFAKTVPIDRSHVVPESPGASSDRAFEKSC